MTPANTIDSRRSLLFDDATLQLRQRCSLKRLRAKSAAVLEYLARNPGRLITQQELLRSVWPETFVSKVVLRVCIAEIRATLGDDAQAILTTVPRRGFRFHPEALGRPVPRPFVCREDELARLHGALGRSTQGRRQVVFVSGEAGIGKTALVDRFLDEVRADGRARLASGQCLELRGGLEDYAPLFDLLSRLCDEPDGAEALRVLARWAPSWLLHLPGRIDDAAAEELRRRVSLPSRALMLRELSEAVEALTRDLPLVLVLRDLHWSDASTVDALAHLAQRDAPARLLIVASYRPHEPRRRSNAFGATKQRLHGRGLCSEIALEPLSREGVEEYLAKQLAPLPVTDEVVAAVYRYSGGHPLFLVAMVEHALELGLLTCSDGVWRFGKSLDSVIPETIEQLAVATLGTLEATQRNIVQVASVIGATFSVALVAAAAGLPIDTVEEACAHLAANHQLADAGVAIGPDGTASGQYRFPHAVYADVIYRRLSSGTRLRLHRALAEGLETSVTSAQRPDRGAP